MKIYPRNSFINHMAISFRKICSIFIVMLFGVSLEAAEMKDPIVLPQIEGLNPIILNEGVFIHPKNLLARFKSPKDVLNFDELINDNDIKLVKQYNLVSGLVLLKVTHNDLEIGDNESLKNNLDEKINKIKKLNSVIYVEYDYLKKSVKAPTDSAYISGDLWGLHNTGQNSGTADADIDAPEAWDITTGSEDVLVAVIDSGLHVTHQDLVSQLWVNEDEIPNNGKDDDNDGYIDNIHGIAPLTQDGNLNDDSTSHGTHVAGTIGASANDNGGHVGVAWSVKLMGIKVGDYWIDTAATIDGIEFAVDHGVTVANCSYGGYSYSQAGFDAYAAGGEAGIMFAVSSMNDSNNNDQLPSYPASYDLECIISVAATDRRDELANFSNYGFDSVDLAAPGVDIYSTYSNADDGYSEMSGTSMAAPHVTGVIALMRSLQPSWTNLEIREQLLSSVDVLTSLEGFVQTSGRLNAFKALAGMSSNVPDGKMQISIIPPSGSMLLAGADQEFFVTVIDGEPVQNATVIGIKDDGNNLYFNNDGDSPDVLRKDNIYSYYMKLPEEPRKMKVTLLVQAPGKNELIRVVNYNIVPYPANDNFQDAAKLSGEGGVVEAFNNFATIEPGEPVHSLSKNSAASLWWNWSPSSTGRAIVDLSGSEIQGVISVYYGTEFTGLTELAANLPIDGQRKNYAYFDAKQGKTYRIAVASKSENDLGYIRLRTEVGGVVDETPPYINVTNPPNGLVTTDERIEIIGNAVDPAPNTSGIKEIQVRVNGSFAVQAIGAEDWSIPLLLKDGLNYIEIVAIDYSNNFSRPSNIEIDYKAPDVPNDHLGNAGLLNRQLIISNGNKNNYTLLQNIANKEDLHIEVNGQALNGDGYELDDFNKRQIKFLKEPAKGSEINIFYKKWLSNIINTKKATKEINEPFHANNEGGASVWWTFTAPYNGVLSVRTVNTKVDTIMAIYQGNRMSDLSLIQSNDDDDTLKELVGNPGFSRIDQALLKGTTVKIAVDGFGGGMGDIGVSSKFSSHEVFKLVVEDDGNGSIKSPKLPFFEKDGIQYNLYSKDSKVMIIADPNEGFSFSGWGGSINSLDNPINLTITDDTNIKASFSLRSLSDDFESGDLARLPWKTDKSNGWFVQNEESYDGGYSLKSGEISNSQVSEVSLSVDSNNGLGSFYVKVDSELNWDKLTFLIDGRIIEEWSGQVEWNKYEFNLTQGTHQLTWKYEKDFANNFGADAAWVDNLKLPISLKASIGMISGKNGHYLRLWGVPGHKYNIQKSVDLNSWAPYGSVIVGKDGIAELVNEIDTGSGAAYFRAVAP